ncbi:15213_t:CDS:2, partial [Racocetra fulgida]
NKFRAQDKKILLLVDNALSHFDLHEDEQDNNTDDDIEYNNFGEQSTSSSTSRLNRNFHKIAKDYLSNVIQIEQDILICEEDTNQIIEDSSYSNLLVDVLNNYFGSLDEKILTEDILNENDIIELIQNKICSKKDNSNYSDDSKKEPELVLLNNASK